MLLSIFYEQLNDDDDDDFFSFAKPAWALRRLLEVESVTSKLTVRLNVRKTSFSQRVIDEWNKLPQHVVDAPSTNSFKKRSS